jgi:hypothetical protein
MATISLKDRLARFLKAYYSQAWISSGELQRIVADKTDYTPQNVGRRLRELENEGVIEVKYVKGHAHYRWSGETYGAGTHIHELSRRSLDWFDSLKNTAVSF